MNLLRTAIDLFKSSTAKGDCGISSSESTFVVSTSETLSSIVGHGSKPLSQSIFMLKKDRLQMHKHNLHVVTHISS